jgi:hypothetical protein
MFACLISRTFSADEQYFSFTTNQQTPLSVMVYQPSEQSRCGVYKIKTSDDAQEPLKKKKITGFLLQW